METCPMSRRKYLALCLSTKDEQWLLDDIPFYCLSEPTHFLRSKSKERIDFLANKWNQCHELGLRLFRGASHIINVGSYYLPQTVALRQLIKRYDELDCEMILAGNVWGRMQDRLLPYKTTYDTWGYPDLAGITWRLRKPTGLIQVNSVAMPCIYPVEAWREHPFHNPENMNEGIWYNQFCLESNLPVLVDASIAFYRSRLDSSIVQLPISKRIRIALGVRKRIRKRFVNNPS